MGGIFFNFIYLFFYSLTIKYFTIDRILHLDKHGKMCKIISEKYFTSKQSIKRMLYEVINNLDGFKSRLVEALQLLLNIQFLFLTKDGVSVSNSSCCHWYEKAQAQGHLYCPWPPPPLDTRWHHNWLILEAGCWFVVYNIIASFGRPLCNT